MSAHDRVPSRVRRRILEVDQARDPRRGKPTPEGLVARDVETPEGRRRDERRPAPRPRDGAA